MWTMDAEGMSDHKPMCMLLRVKCKRWRRGVSGLDKRPRIKWECLKDEEKKREYKRRTNELIQEERKEDMSVE